MILKNDIRNFWYNPAILIPIIRRDSRIICIIEQYKQIGMNNKWYSGSIARNDIEAGKWYIFVGDNNYPELQSFVKGHEYYSPEDGKISVGTDVITINCKGAFVDADSYNVKEVSKVEHPSHYTWLKNICGIEVIDITRHMTFNLGNVVKYVLRAGHKSEKGYSDKEKQIEDLKKARFYIDDEIKRLENE